MIGSLLYTVFLLLQSVELISILNWLNNVRRELVAYTGRDLYENTDVAQNINLHISYSSRTVL